MSTAEFIIGLGGLVLAVLTYFAGVERGKRYRTQDQQIRQLERQEDHAVRLESERENRITKALESYRALVHSTQSSNLNGMLRAGVLSLESSDEVAHACQRIKSEGLTLGIPDTYMTELRDCDLLLFFKLLSQRPDDARTGGGVRRIIEEVRNSQKEVEA